MGTEEVRRVVAEGALLHEWVEPMRLHLVYYGRGVHAVTEWGEEIAYWRAGSLEQARAEMARWQDEALDYGGF